VGERYAPPNLARFASVQPPSSNQKKTRLVLQLATVNNAREGSAGH
jgi:hypothetical protein